MELTIENITNDAYQNFIDYVPNENTRLVYLRLLREFLEAVPKSIFQKELQRTGKTVPELSTLFVDLTRKDIHLSRQIIMAYIRELKIKNQNGEINFATVKNKLKPVKALFDANEIDFAWKLINKSIPKPGVSQDRAYTTEEIQKMILGAGNLTDKVIVLLFSSAGFRLGAWDYFTWKDIKFFNHDDKPKGLGIRVYAGEAEEYWTHGTPEAQKMLILYREEWKSRFGKYPEDDDPLLVSQRHSYITRLASGGVAGRVINLLKKTGIRGHLDNPRKGHPVQADHGFRKFFNTMCRRAKVDYVDKEDMMGHVTGLEKNYERYTEEDFERFPEYQKAIPFLTISDEDRALHELYLEKQKTTELEISKNEINKLKSTLDTIVEGNKLQTRQLPKGDLKEMMTEILKEHNML